MMNQKKAMVTGASEGIGRAFAKRLAADGYEITATARNELRLEELLQDLGGDPHSYRVADLSSQEGIDQISSELSQNQYNLLVNNAGFGLYSRFDKESLPKLQKMTRLNCDALVAFSHAFLKAAKKGDALVNVASTLALLPMPAAGLYSATKAFVITFSETLWFEQKDRGVYVMCLCPGITSTNFHKRAGMKDYQPFPSALTQSPEEVVNVAMKALKTRKNPTAISGPRNLMMTTFARLMPRKVIIKMMGAMV